MSDPRLALKDEVLLSSSRVRAFDGFIFLCGGRVDVSAQYPPSIRDAIYRGLVGDSLVEPRIRLAETYKEWADDGIYSDLLSFERHIAELSSVIVLALESAGSIAELGLFSVLDEFRHKLIVFISTHHYQQSSFIRLGPVQSLERGIDNPAHCYDFIKVDYLKRESFDAEFVGEVQDELAGAVKERITNAVPEAPFDPGRWLHQALLVLELVNLMAALTVTEVRDFLLSLGVDLKQKEIKQTLFLLERLQLISMVPSGEQRFYVGKSGANFLYWKATSGHFDVDRFKFDAVAFYKKNDKKRFRAIQKVLGSI